MLLYLISSIAVISAFLCIQGKYSKRTLQIYIFKPLTTILILIIAIIASKNLSGTYKYIILLALLFSLFGDIFLMLPDRFLHGLISFFIAHLMFLFAFIILGNSLTWWLAVIFALAGLLIYKYLLPYLGKLKIPVLLYVLIIVAMAWRAWENYFLFGSTATLMISISTLLFVISDTNIAINKFRKKYMYAEAIILITYFASIWLLALSLNYL